MRIACQVYQPDADALLWVFEISIQNFKIKPLSAKDIESLFVLCSARRSSIRSLPSEADPSVVPLVLEVQGLLMFSISMQLYW